jgi:hypothetical protein
MNKTFFKRAPFCYKILLVMFLKGKCSFCYAFFLLRLWWMLYVIEWCVCFFLFVCVMFRDWSSSWESRSIPWKNLKFSLSKASGLLPCIFYLKLINSITKFTFMICIIWWVTYSNTPSLSNLIPWSNLGIVLYFNSYAIARTLTLCSHSLMILLFQRSCYFLSLLLWMSRLLNKIIYDNWNMEWLPRKTVQLWGWYGTPLAK